MCTVGIIGGTPRDAEIGQQMLARLGVAAPCLAIASGPDEQNVLQYERQMDAQTRTEEAIRELERQGCSTTVVFCNSLAVILDQGALDQCARGTVFSPVHIYKEVASRTRRPFIIAFNARCAASVERAFIAVRPGTRGVSFAHAQFVDDLEQGASFDSMFKQQRFDDVITLARVLDCDSIVLACTHLSLGASRFDDRMQTFDVGSMLLKKAMA